MTTTNADILLAAIIAEPEDDTVRLAYADELEANGEVDRAEFVRVQIELTKTPKLVEVGNVGYSTNPQWKELKRREFELWAYLPKRDGVLSQFSASVGGPQSDDTV